MNGGVHFNHHILFFGKLIIKPANSPSLVALLILRLPHP